MSLEMWILKYRPKNLEQFVWGDPAMRKTVEGWLAAKALPHCLFSGHQGCGKTSLALLLLNILAIPSEDILQINASRIRRVEELQDRMIGFIDAWAFNPTGLKYIFLDESDKLSQTSQGMLRAEMENYPNCRFIMTCNEPRKIIMPLHSRLQEIKFGALDRAEFALRAADVLLQEGVPVEPEILMAYVHRLYPDLRKLLGDLQLNSQDGVLQPISDAVTTTQDYLLKVIDLFMTGKILDARKLLIEQTDPADYPDIFRYFYQHLEVFGATQDQQDKALLAIRDAMVHHSVVADPEINLAALLAELSLINRAKNA
jgi:DNA polymerase III delta prime subunit